MWGGGKTRPWARDFSSSALVFLKMMELEAMVSRLVAGSQMQMRFSWAFHVLRALRAAVGEDRSPQSEVQGAGVPARPKWRGRGVGKVGAGAGPGLGPSRVRPHGPTLKAGPGKTRLSCTDGETEAQRGQRLVHDTQRTGGRLGPS